MKYLVIALALCLSACTTTAIAADKDHKAHKAAMMSRVLTIKRLMPKLI